ncbi:PhzF family phenazine biosynthesis protein [Noviherbaspirillum sp. CPCC 100848]|uniref:PhzF family phenazine biosynthesis protein n=1 Tax=Noviherbaspirillum album TaxID=3080276 RepID=A0ABU6JHH3_9BURK|nr:PhzF family phenazine biosynthesis protein [Noviherbaspirillum sp. CPCC 100848]MEC4722652.1 PhzF family phenazine biosynthesis protein [Noviherbaspirillum sp. CPCC 100848]
MAAQMQVEVRIVNAFIDGERGGNPAGVVLDAERFSREQKQAIAASVGLSETAFVSPSREADFKLEFFTPSRQIAHCGHATIATFGYLQQLRRISRADSSKETIDGTRTIRLQDGMAFMEQLAPRYTELGGATPGIDIDSVLASLALNRDDLIEGQAPAVVHTGNAFLVVPLKNEAALLRAQPQMGALEAVSEQLDLIGYYLFSPETRVPGRHAGTRMFAPRYGIAEEAATGMAAGPLACFLHDRLHVDADTLLIEQGYLMPQPSPSVITVKLNKADGRITGLMAGGQAAVMESRVVKI